MRLRVASFNANSIRSRLDVILDWIAANDCDVLCVQETKVTDEDFPAMAFAEALMKTVRDPRVKALPAYAGSVDTFSDCTDVMDRPDLCRKLRAIYR